MITLKRFLRLEKLLRDAGFAEDIDWSEAVPVTISPEEFADHAIYVICNSGMKNSVAEEIHKRCMIALYLGKRVRRVFGHPGKSKAIEQIWRDREVLFVAYLIAAEPVSFLQCLPWIGPITSYHLAKNLGADVAKPDVHLERLARRDKTTTHRLYRRLARETGYRVATIDTILWRACAEGLLNSTTYERAGWMAAYNPTKLSARLTD
ncbi:hypothetical protein GGR90_002249 [Sphingopyxis italica]|uniref:Uncharacterized protein n=1 Tax=Sphingopyxis italica TaxID=1129133 RepID=A0A7X5XSC2_9SPHN|nr:hypothetical protein [Sphingopyxis italica]NJB90074.1 hypothetical protein [Sphingopyxis italica]